MLHLWGFTTTRVVLKEPSKSISSMLNPEMNSVHVREGGRQTPLWVQVFTIKTLFHQMASYLSLTITFVH